MMGIIKNTPARAVKKTKWMKVRVKKWYRRGGKWRYYWTYRWVKRIYLELQPL